MKKYRLTLAFALTAVIAIALATTTVNWVIGNLAEDNLVRIAEENTARDGVHIQSMMAVGSQHSMPGMAATGGQRSMDGTASAGAAEGDNTMEDMQRPVPLSLKSLVQQMPDGHSQLVEGLSIPKMSLLDPSGTVVWSTDSQSISTSKLESPLYQQAIAGGTASRLARAQDVIDAMGVSRRMDIVETHLHLPVQQARGVVGGEPA